MSRLLLAILFLAALGGAGYYGATRMAGDGSAAGAAGEPSAAGIPVKPLERRAIVRKVSAIGVLAARESRMVSASFSGKIMKLVPEGSLVQKGDDVVWLETTDIEEQLVERELQLETAKTDLERVEEERKLTLVQQALEKESQEAQLKFNELRLEDAKRSLEEQRVLVDRDIAAESTLEDARIEVLQAELSLREARINLRKTEEKHASDLRVKDVDIERNRAELQKRQDEVDREKAKLEKAVIKAPGAGFVSMLYTWRGQRAKIQEGDEVWEGRGIMELPDSTQMTAVAPVSELDINAVKIGQPAIVRVAALPGEEFRGAVEKKGSVPLTQENAQHFMTQTEGVKRFEVAVAFDQQDERFRQHMTASVEIEVDRAESVLAAPLEAIFKDRETGKWKVYALKRSGGDAVAAAGGYEASEVELGTQDADFAAIVSANPPLAEGAMLLCRDPGEPAPRNL